MAEHAYFAYLRNEKRRGPKGGRNPLDFSRWNRLFAEEPSFDYVVDSQERAAMWTEWRREANQEMLLIQHCLALPGQHWQLSHNHDQQEFEMRKARLLDTRRGRDYKPIGHAPPPYFSNNGQNHVVPPYSSIASSAAPPGVNRMQTFTNGVPDPYIGLNTDFVPLQNVMPVPHSEPTSHVVPVLHTATASNAVAEPRLGQVSTMVAPQLIRNPTSQPDAEGTSPTFRGRNEVTPGANTNAIPLMPDNHYLRSEAPPHLAIPRPQQSQARTTTVRRSPIPRTGASPTDLSSGSSPQPSTETQNALSTMSPEERSYQASASSTRQKTVSTESPPGMSPQVLQLEAPPGLAIPRPQQSLARSATVRRSPTCYTVASPTGISSSLSPQPLTEAQNSPSTLSPEERSHQASTSSTRQTTISPESTLGRSPQALHNARIDTAAVSSAPSALQEWSESTLPMTGKEFLANWPLNRSRRLSVLPSYWFPKNFLELLKEVRCYREAELRFHSLLLGLSISTPRMTLTWEEYLVKCPRDPRPSRLQTLARAEAKMIDLAYFLVRYVLPEDWEGYSPKISVPT